jgi:outer membrane receptor protein involved in Fe transport
VFVGDWIATPRDERPLVLMIGKVSTAPVSTCTAQSSLSGTTISNGFTGFGLASFLLGCVSSAISSAIAAMTENYPSAAYVQDSWKVTRKLTVDYGLRWDYGTYYGTYHHEQFGRYASFSPMVANPSAGGELGGQIFQSQLPLPVCTQLSFRVWATFGHGLPSQQ